MTGAPLEMKIQFHLPETMSSDEFEFKIDGAVFSAVLS
jgi:hypothetical protein